jgi:hypothetical protein
LIPISIEKGSEVIFNDMDLIMKSSVDLLIAPSSEKPYCKKVQNFISINPG